MQPDAVQDILLDDRYEGMMSTIDGLTGIVDSMFMTVITFVAFFIISVALLRNVLAGAYCAFPKFWDQVARAHEENENKAFFEEIKGIKDSYKTASMGSIKTFVLRIVPNIKSLTDFEDNTLSPKSYFIKAIPQMIGVVIIGVFIYNGYYRDFTAIVANTGAELVQRVVLDTDPMEIIDTFLNTAGRPHFATDDSIDDYGKNKNKIAVGIYQAIISKYPDITDANAKANLASAIDTAVDGMFPKDSVAKDWFGNDVQYKVTITCNLMKPFSADTLWENIGEDMKPDADKFRCGWMIGIGKEGSAGATTGSYNVYFDTVKEAVNEEWCVGVSVIAERNATVTNTGDVIEVEMKVLSSKPASAPTSYLSGLSGISDSTSFPITDDEDNTYTVKFLKCGEIADAYYCPYIDADSLSKQSFTANTTISIRASDNKTVRLKVTKVTTGDSPSITSVGNEGDAYTVSTSSNVVTATKNETSDDDSKNNGDGGGDAG